MAGYASVYDCVGLAELERGFLGDADAPSVPEEHEVLGIERIAVDRLGQRRLGIGDHRRHVVPQMRPQQGEGGRREPRLHDRALVGEVERHDVVGERDRPARRRPR